jgi:hypothetical protein
MNDFKLLVSVLREKEKRDKELKALRRPSSVVAVQSPTANFDEEMEEDF